MSYQVGDVVFCRFPLREDPSKYLPRPALIMKVVVPGKLFKAAQITSTDRRGRQCGYWIEKKSSHNRIMRLKTDSFINLANILEIKEQWIDRFIGTCPIMVELDKMCRDAGIQY